MNNSMKILFLALVIGILALSGCEDSSKTVYKSDDAKVETTQEGKEITQKITTDEGTVTSTGTIGKEGWCAEGTDWNWNSDSNQNIGTGTMKIDKLMTSGKYAGLCHVIYTMQSAEGSVNIEYYFSEDGKSGYYIMDANGQKFEQEWHG